VAALTKVGALVGETQQLHDDLDDALAVPAQPDWRRPRNNLLTLYALTVDHPERERFIELLKAPGIRQPGGGPGDPLAQRSGLLLRLPPGQAASKRRSTWWRVLTWWTCPP